MLIQAPLSPSSEPDGLDAQETISMLSPFPPSSGMAWLYVNRDGSITYNAQITDLQEPPVFTLTPTGKGKKTLDTQQFSPTHVSNGLATGTLDKLRWERVKETELLHSEHPLQNVLFALQSEAVGVSVRRWTIPERIFGQNGKSRKGNVEQ